MANIAWRIIAQGSSGRLQARANGRRRVSEHQCAIPSVVPTRFLLCYIGTDKHPDSSWASHWLGWLALVEEV